MDGRFRAIEGGKGRKFNDDSRFARRRESAETYVDYSLIFTVIFLLAFGLIMIFSVSSYEANLTFGDSSYYFKKQLGAVLFGLVMMTATAMIPYHFWEKFAVPAWFVSAILIALVLTPLGHESHGARRWLNLGISLQPAEVAKLGMIVFLAYMACKLGKSLYTAKGFAFMLITPGIISLMIWKITDNMSSAIIVLGISVCIVFVASPDYRKFIILALSVVAVGIIAVFSIVQLSKNGSSLAWRSQRILAWLNPEAYASGKGFQTLQALYAIGSGGLFGKGLGQSIQKQGFIPEAQNDMIFSVICEELGIFGALIVLFLFGVLLWRCMIAANNAPDMFGGLIIVGVMAHIAVQVVLNIAVCTNVIPNTGISLPFISYGGSSVVFLLIEVGLVLSVCRSIKLREL